MLGIDEHKKLWGYFADHTFSQGFYEEKIDAIAQNNYFKFKTKRTIPPFNYFNLLLLTPNNNLYYINESTDKALVNFCMNEANYIYYVYNSKPGDFVPINVQNRDGRDFWNWIRALSIIAQYSGFMEYEEKYFEWIMRQRNNDGLWEFPKKFEYSISNSWRGKNKMIDSSIYVIRLLMKKKGY